MCELNLFKTTFSRIYFGLGKTSFVPELLYQNMLLTGSYSQQDNVKPSRVTDRFLMLCKERHNDPNMMLMPFSEILSGSGKK